MKERTITNYVHHPSYPRLEFSSKEAKKIKSKISGGVGKSNAFFREFYGFLSASFHLEINFEHFFLSRIVNFFKNLVTCATNFWFITLKSHFPNCLWHKINIVMRIWKIQNKSHNHPQNFFFFIITKLFIFRKASLKWKFNYKVIERGTNCCCWWLADEEISCLRSKWREEKWENFFCQNPLQPLTDAVISSYY